MARPHILIVLCYLFIEPLAPYGFEVTRELDTTIGLNVTFGWNPPVALGPEAIVDSYIISIIPEPLSHPISSKVNSTRLKVTLLYNEEYTVTVTSVNCAGASNPLEATNIVFSK